MSCALQAEVPDLEGDQGEPLEHAIPLSQAWEVHEYEVGAKPLVPPDALIVVEEVAAAEQDQLALMYLDCFGMMR